MSRELDAEVDLSRRVVELELALSRQIKHSDDLAKMLLEKEHALQGLIPIPTRYEGCCPDSDCRGGRRFDTDHDDHWSGEKDKGECCSCKGTNHVIVEESYEPCSHCHQKGYQVKARKVVALAAKKAEGVK